MVLIFWQVPDGTKKENKDMLIFSLDNLATGQELIMKNMDIEKARKGMARWFANAMENARLDPTAQEFHNTNPDPYALALKMKPNGEAFVDNLTVFDCSKVSDGASGIAICSEEGLKKIGIDKKDAVEVVGWAQVNQKYHKRSY